MRKCSCVYVHPWPILCPMARAWQAKLASAIKAGDDHEFRRIGELLARHREGQALPERDA